MSTRSQELPSLGRTAAAPRRRPPEWLAVLGVGIAAAVVFAIPYGLRPVFYYTGDNPESFLPLWHHLGAQLRAGQWPVMDPAGWYGGNYAAEGEYSLWNPVQVANYVLVSFFDNLAAAAATVMVEFLALLSMAAYLLAREYGAERPAAAALGLAMPACGFSMYYASAGWPVELIALTWVAWFWWGTRRFVRGRTTPLVPFVFGALAATSGNPYALVAMGVVLLGIGVDLLVRKQYRRLGQMLLLGACAGATSAVIFLPMLATMSITSREQLAMISNDFFLVPHLGDLAASSAPTYLPPIVNWNGAAGESVPSTYFAWFLLPLLPWLRWRGLRGSVRRLLGVLVITMTFLLSVLGPSNLWFFRWPIRMIEFCYLGVAVLTAVALSAGLARDRVRNRTIVSVALIAAGAYLSAAATPQFHTIHALATILVLGLVAAAVGAYHRWGPQALGAALATGTVVILTYQVARLPVLTPGSEVEPPISVSRARQDSALAEGTVLQLARQATVRTQDYADGALMFGNENILRGHETINRYSGIGYAKFNVALCIDYKGVECAESLRRLWLPAEGTNVPLVDALRVRTLVLQRSLFPGDADRPPPGWRVADSGQVRTIWVRTAENPLPGRVSWASPGVVVHSADAHPEQETVDFEAPAEGGRLLFARLNWPGYSATIAGSGVGTQETAEGLLAVDVPPGRHVLHLAFTEPGLRPGAVIAGVAAALVLAQAVWIRRRNGRRESKHPSEFS